MKLALSDGVESDGLLRPFPDDGNQDASLANGASKPSNLAARRPIEGPAFARRPGDSGISLPCDRLIPAPVRVTGKPMIGGQGRN